jgi:uncharacterized repeat protein (TIGR01451 family)
MRNFTKSVLSPTSPISFCFALPATFLFLCLFSIGQLQAQTVSIDNSHAGLPLNAGDVITYTFTVTNNTSSIMSSMSISDPIPGAPAVFVPNSLLVGGSNLTCTVPTTITNAISISGFSLLPAENLVYRFQMKIPDTYSGTAIVTHTAIVGTVSATTSNTISAIPALSLVKSGTTDVTAGTVNKTGLIHYKVVITNTGTSTAKSVVFKDKLDLINVNFIATNNVLVSQDYLGSYTVNKGTAIADDSVRVTLGDMPMGASATIKFTVRTKATVSGSLTNTATATSTNLTAGTSAGTATSNTTTHTVNTGTTCTNRNIYYLSVNGNNGTAEVNNPNKPWVSFKVIIDLINTAGGNAVLRFLDAYYPTSASGSVNPVLNTPCVTIDGNFCIFDRNSGSSVGFLGIANGANGDTIRNLRLTNFNKSPDCSFDITGTSPASPITGLVLDDVKIYATQAVKATSLTNVSGAKFTDCEWSNNPFGAIDIVDAKATFTDCNFYCNSRGGQGGAIDARIKSGGAGSDAHFTELTFIRGEFSGNNGTGGGADGGAICMGVGTLNIDGTKFSCNSSDASTGLAGGGAIRLLANSGSSGKPIATIRNAVFYNNTCTSGTDGGAILGTSNGAVTLDKCIFKNNVSGNGSAINVSSPFTVNNCIFEGNSTGVAIVGSPSSMDSTTVKGNSGAGVSGTIGTLSNSIICGNTGVNMSTHPTTVINSLYGTSAEAINNSTATTTNAAASQGSYTFTEGTNATFLTNDASAATAGYVFTNGTSGNVMAEAAAAPTAGYTFTSNSNLLQSTNACTATTGYTLTSDLAQTIYTNNDDAQGTAVFGTGVSQSATGGNTGGFWQISSTGFLEVPIPSDLTGLTNVLLTYKKKQVTAGTASNVRVEVSSNGGTTWTAATAQSSTTNTTGWVSTAALSFTTVSNNMRLRFSKVTPANADVGVEDLVITYNNAIQQAANWQLDPTDVLTGSTNIVLTNYANPEVTFDIASIGNTGVNPTGKFEYSTDGGTSWTVATTTLNPTSSTFATAGPFTISANTATFRMRFTATNTSGNSLGIDNVKIYYDNNIQQTADWLLDQNDVIETGDIDLTGISSVNLQYQQYSPASAPYNNSGTTQSKVSFEYSLNGGGVWTAGTLPTAAATTTLANAFAAAQTIALGSSSISNFRLRFKNAQTGDKSVAIDNIALTYTHSTPIQQTGYWLLEPNDLIETAAMNLTGVSSVNVQYDIAASGSQNAYQYGTLEYSTNNGTSWAAVTNTQTPTSTSLPNVTAFASPLNIALGGTTVTQFKLRFKHNGLWGKALQMDNLVITYNTTQSIQQAGVGAGGVAGFWLLEQSDVITSNNIDLTGLTTVKVQYQIAASGAGPTTTAAGTFEYSINGGSTWSVPTAVSTTATTYGNAFATILSLGSPNVSNFRMRFKHNGAFGKTLSIDNIVITYDQPITCSSTTVGSNAVVGTYACLSACPTNPNATTICITFADMGNLSLSGCKFINTYTEHFGNNTPSRIKIQAGQSFTALLSNFTPVFSPANTYQWRYLVVNPNGIIVKVVSPALHATLAQITNTTITPTYPVGMTVIPGTHKVYGYYYNTTQTSAPTVGASLASLAGNTCGSVSKNYAEFEVLNPIVETVTAACAGEGTNTCPNRYMGTVTITGGYPQYATLKGILAPQYVIGADKTYSPIAYTNEMTGWVSYGTTANYMNSYGTGQSFGVKTEDDGNCTLYPYALDTAAYATPTDCKISILGSVLYDRDGGSIGGFGINKVNGLQLYAYLISTTGTPCVVAKVPIAANGSYSFLQDISPNTYQICLSTEPNASIGAVGAALPSPALPTTGANGAWSNTAEGLSAAGDGAANGLMSSVIVTSTSNITNANFALNSTIPLPAILTLFDGQLAGNDADLFWVTKEERNVDVFKVEHSVDGMAFSEVGSVKAMGNSVTDNEYIFKHKEISFGKNYYRLKMVDIDGKYAHSNQTVILERGKGDNLMLYPNPAHNSVTLEHPISIKNVKVKLMDISGRMIRIIEIPAYSAKTTLSLEGIDAGVYMLIWNGELNQKLVIY